MHPGTRRQFFVTSMFDGQHWLENVRFDVDNRGWISTMQAGVDRPAGCRHLPGIVLPGMPNLHSHAFQRAMAGRAEYSTNPVDSFWTWREAMYQTAARLDPDGLELVARQLYTEMLKQGYTHVCEFHYLHLDQHGRTYANPTEMSQRLLAAAQGVGIGITLLPVIYQRGGFDNRALSSRQRRFALRTDDYLGLVEHSIAETESVPAQSTGIALHSLRAVSQETMGVVLEAGLGSVVHIHIAEQMHEVEECVQILGARPVAWLLDRFGVDARWCLVHATHVQQRELADLAATGAVAGLCPTTEANLGDGIFPLRTYLDAGGRMGIGSDSQVSVSPVEELRWLEYGQRLITQRRNIAADAKTPHCGSALWSRGLAGGAQASGHRIGRLACGYRGDWVVLAPDAPWLAGATTDSALDSWIFAGNDRLVQDVYVAGRQVIANGHHAEEEATARKFRSIVAALV